MHFVILGAGISGISFAYHLDKKENSHVIYEKRKSWGGLCDNFILDNRFLFDYFVHLSFSENEYVKKLFNNSSDYISHYPLANNYYNGYWIKHPVQYNLAPLPIEEKTKVIIDYFNKPKIKNSNNYKCWLNSNFGVYFSEIFPEKYTKKYWAINAEKLTTEWISTRIGVPSPEQLIKGSFEVQKDNFYYAKEMRYPIRGGYKSFLNLMANQVNIITNKCVSLIDLKRNEIYFEDGSSDRYEKLISSLPIPVLINCIKDCPKYIKEAAEKLCYTSGQLVSFVFNRPDVPKDLWFYIYDEDILPARAYSPSMKSKKNVVEGFSSMQFETYNSRYFPKNISGDNLIEHIIKNSERMKLFSKADILMSDYREVEFANVIFDFKRKKNLAIIHQYLRNNGIKYIGRFGEWDYLWSDQSLLSGMNAAEEINNYEN